MRSCDRVPIYRAGTAVASDPHVPTSLGSGVAQQLAVNVRGERRVTQNTEELVRELESIMLCARRDFSGILSEGVGKGASAQIIERGNCGWYDTIGAERCIDRLCHIRLIPGEGRAQT